MKKPILAAIACALSASVACGCAADDAAYTLDDRQSLQPVQPIYVIERKTDEYAPDNTEIMDGDFLQPSIPGVRIYKEHSLAGKYYSEYIHSPISFACESSMRYDLDLKEDNTFEMNITSDNTNFKFTGHWYSKHDQITLYYDSSDNPLARDLPGHTSYDCTYGEVYPQGKIMLYENSGIIVMARVTESSNN